MTAVPEPTLFSGKVPGLVWRGAGVGRRAAIVSVHGGGGSKANVDPVAVERVTSSGVTLVTIDAHRHGDRPDAIGPDDSTLTTAVFVEILEVTGHELVEVVQELGSDSRIDPARVGFRGGSMGVAFLKGASNSCEKVAA